MDALVAKAHQLCFVTDINCVETSKDLVGKRVRITGKLASYDPALLRASVVHPVGKSATTLVVSTKHLAAASLVVGSLYQFLGEIIDDSGALVLCAKTVRNVDGLDVEKYFQAVKLQQQYLTVLSSVYLITMLMLLTMLPPAQVASVACNACGPECANACGTAMFRACCFNYNRKRSSPPMSLEPLAQLQMHFDDSAPVGTSEEESYDGDRGSSSNDRPKRRHPWRPDFLWTHTAKHGPKEIMKELKKLYNFNAGF